jgi:hypothetical protein
MRANLARVGPEVVRSEGDFSRVALPNADADVLRDLLLQEEAEVVLEIGLAYSVSALAIAEALISHGKRCAAHLIIDASRTASMTRDGKRCTSMVTNYGWRIKGLYATGRG